VRLQNKLIDREKFAKFLWGDIFYNLETKKFSKQKKGDSERSFVHFILEPFYKMIGLTMTKDRTDMLRLLKIELGGIEKKFNKSDFEMDVRPLLRLVMSQIFGSSSHAIVESMNCHFQTAKDAMVPYLH
jgi:U5 small nuclear ribonucleoprotein component